MGIGAEYIRMDQYSLRWVPGRIYIYLMCKNKHVSIKPTFLNLCLIVRKNKAIHSSLNHCRGIKGRYEIRYLTHLKYTRRKGASGKVLHYTGPIQSIIDSTVPCY